MNIFSRIKIAFSNNYFDKYVSDFLSGNDLNNDNDCGYNSALKYSVFFACCKRIAESFALVPIVEYKKRHDGTKEKTNDTGLFDILHNAPNDEMNAHNFKECLIYQILLGGNFVAERLYNGNKLVGLYPIQWNEYCIRRDSHTKKLKYQIINNELSNVILDRSRVLHIPGVSLDGIIGLSILEYASKSLSIGSSYNSFSKNLFSNGVLSTGVFKHPGFLKEESFKRLRDEIKNNYQGMSNSGIPMILEDGLDFQQLNMKPSDAEFLESKKFQIEEICRFFGMSPHMIQHLDRMTFNNVEQLSLEFVKYTMAPYFSRVENAINSQLLTLDQRNKGYFFEFNIEALLRGDIKSRYEAFSKARQWGWLSVNEIRQKENLNRIDGGDRFLEPMNMNVV